MKAFRYTAPRKPNSRARGHLKLFPLMDTGYWDVSVVICETLQVRAIEKHLVNVVRKPNLANMTPPLPPSLSIQRTPSTNILFKLGQKVKS